MNKLIIATRASDLALWQAYHIKERIEKSFPEITVELNKIVSKGDKILDKPLALVGGKGLRLVPLLKRVFLQKNLKMR